MNYMTTVIKYTKPSNQFIEDIIVTMLEGGSNYWISYVDATPPKQKGVPTSIWVANIVNRGGIVYVYPTECNNKKYALTKPKLLSGIQKFVENHPKRVSKDGSKLDGGSFDANDADCILQYSIFGKVVFG